jgi:hypothetical protein
LAYITGLVNQRLLPQCGYLVAEIPILRSHVSGRLRLSDPERPTLAEIAKRLGGKQLAEVACMAQPEIILAWYRLLIACKFDGSKHRLYLGRPEIDPAIEARSSVWPGRTPAGAKIGSPAPRPISVTISRRR